MKLRKIKKGQEEMAGFVLIVIMVVIMAVAFLFLMRPKVESKKDLQAGNMLNSILESSEAGKTIGEMIEACVTTDLQCTETTDAIGKRLNASLSSYGLVLNRTIQGYVFNATSEGSTTPIILKDGKTTLSSTMAISPRGRVEVNLKFYY